MKIPSREMYETPSLYLQHSHTPPSLEHSNVLTFPGQLRELRLAKRGTSVRQGVISKLGSGGEVVSPLLPFRNNYSFTAGSDMWFLNS
jgi:hypothetical protein